MTQEAPSVAQIEDPSCSHRVYLADSIGCLRVAQCAAPSHLPENYSGPTINTVVLPGFKSHSDHAVQRLARGVLSGDVYVVAMARKNATVDVIHLENQQLPSSSSNHAAGSSKSTSSPTSSEQIRARILCIIKEDKMKAGIHRFIGLAVGPDGIYSITSSGIFRFTPIQIQRSDNGEILAQRGQSKVVDLLPSPLQHASFYPSTDPTHFCYGGEDIPLSIWNIRTALSEPNHSTPKTDHVADESIDSMNGTTDDADLNSKQRKRKRQREAKSKASELLWGEVWRAKNLPNDNLSLPRRANITATCILHLSTQDQTDSDSRNDQEDASFSADTTIVVGTKDGLLRIFEPGKGSRKHTREIRVVPINAHQVAIKTLCASSHPLDPQKGGVIFVGDTGSKVYCVDWRSGSVLYGYKNMSSTGSVLSMTLLPSPSMHRKKSGKSFSSEPESLVAVSSDSLVKFYSTATAATAVPAPGKSAEKGEMVWSKMLVQDKNSVSAVNATPTAVIWDGVMPVTTKPRSSRSDGEEHEEDFENDDDDDNEDAEDQVWAEMEEIDDSTTKSRKSHSRENNEDDDDVDDDDDDNENEEATAKTAAPQKKRGSGGGKKPRK